MKKLIIAIIGIAFLGSCASNQFGCPYTYENVETIQSEKFIDQVDFSKENPSMDTEAQCDFVCE